jgi:hypothetical protein
MTKGEPIKPDTILGDILKTYPVLRTKIRDLFGPECLQCRSNQSETITYTSWHKGLDPARVCQELNAALRGGSRDG